VRRLAAGSILILFCAACGSASHTLAAKSLPHLVLQRGDLPGWTRFQNDAGTAADAGVLGARKRTGAWIARYRSPSGIVVSRIDLYGSAADAKAVFAQLQSAASAGTAVRSIPTPSVGDERVGYLAGTSLKLESIFWRRANAIGSIVVQGREVAKPDAAALSEKVDGRMKAGG
jgi:hypothetical protein